MARNVRGCVTGRSAYAPNVLCPKRDRARDRPPFGRLSHETIIGNARSRRPTATKWRGPLLAIDQIMMSSIFRERRARVVLAADPKVDPALMAGIEDALRSAPTNVRLVTPAQGDLETWIQVLLPRDITEADVVIVVRTESKPSRDVSLVADTARVFKRPIHVLHLPTVDVGIPADGAQTIAAAPTPANLRELARWASGLAKTYGPA
jgi:hypothetical protein